ncbi:MAG: FAD-dependent monooxygenase [Rickettsiaceae bacterium]
MHHKITIAGCGLSGMISALALASYNIPVTIVEHRSTYDKSFFNDIRTTAITASSRKFLDSIGIWSKLQRHIGRIKDIYVVDNKSPNMIHFDSSVVGNGDVMGFIIENAIFKQSLLELVLEHELITLIDHTPYSIKHNNLDYCTLLLADGTEMQSDLVILCNGSNSNIKQQYFSCDVEKSYSQYALTFIVQHQKSHECTAVEHFMPNGPFAILPLRDQNSSSIVWTVKAEMHNALLNLPKEEFLYLVQQNFGEFLGEISIESKVASFPLKAQHVRKYFNKRIVLAADSAHVIHPLAGQGLNQGIKDIDNLITNIIQYGTNNTALVNYEKSMKPDNIAMFEITDHLNLLFSNNSCILRDARKLGFKAIETMPILKNLLMNYAMGRR